MGTIDPPPLKLSPPVLEFMFNGAKQQKIFFHLRLQDRWWLQPAHDAVSSHVVGADEASDDALGDDVGQDDQDQNEHQQDAVDVVNLHSVCHHFEMRKIYIINIALFIWNWKQFNFLEITFCN